MMNLALLIFASVLLFVSMLSASAFTLSGGGSRALRSSGARLQTRMLFDFFGKKQTATASHILVAGADGPKVLNELKSKLNASKNLERDFANAATQYSSCPSAQKGGALGTFKQGQMVPAFDKVVFKEAVGVVHGPVATPFGNHLILIKDRSEKEK